MEIATAYLSGLQIQIRLNLSTMWNRATGLNLIYMFTKIPKLIKDSSLLPGEAGVLIIIQAMASPRTVSCFPSISWPKGKWIRKVVGIGNNGALGIPVCYIALRSPAPGYIHFYLDNVVLRKNDGTIRSVIWQDHTDTTATDLQVQEHQLQ